MITEIALAENDLGDSGGMLVVEKAEPPSREPQHGELKP